MKIRKEKKINEKKSKTKQTEKKMRKWERKKLERLSPSNSLSSTHLRLVHPLTPCPSYTISLLHHLPFIHRNTLHARCVKACLNRRNAIAYVLPTEWWRTKERNIQTISVFMVTCQGHDLDLNFFLINLLLWRRSAYTGNFKSIRHFVRKI